MWKSVQTAEQIRQVAELAAVIWEEHYRDQLGPDQIAYMLEKFQSAEAIRRQIAEDAYRYYLIGDGEPVGYVGVQPMGRRLFLSKLYIRREARGAGLATKTLRFLEDICRREGLVAIWLTANKHNTSSLEIYRHWGFRVVDEQVEDIGGGYVKDDYILEKPVDEPVMPRRPFGRTGVQVSPLGFGAMRMPTLPDGSIDEPQAIAMIRAAIDGGVNYVDTAYFYHDGKSESLVGKALRDGYREKVFVATKSPMVFIHQPEDFDRILDEQLDRLQINTIDFYLLHALDRGEWEKKAVPFGLLDKLEAARAAGKIRYIGFSFHDSNEVFHEIVDGYDWDFCQIQMNYVNVDYQAGLEGLQYAASKGLGVIIMEPLLGGRLAAPPQSVRKLLPAERTPVEWAFDYLWDRPEVSLLLSGMSTPAQVQGNLLYAARSAVGMLTEEQRALFPLAKQAHDTMAKVACTGCSYCMPCSFGVNIPGVFAAYNRSAVSEEEGKAAYAALEGRAALCRSCGKCEKACPQHLPIRQLLAEAEGALLPAEETTV